MVFQDAMASLDSVWTIESQLTSVLRANEKLSRRDARDRAREWLLRVGLTQTERVMRARPYELSGGMRQRMMLAIALCTRPRLLIADEPTSALDAVLAESVMELMSELTAELSASLLIVSHDIDLCCKFADTIVVFQRGRVVEELDTAKVSEARHPYSRGLLNCIPALDSADLDRLPTLEDFAPSADNLEAAQ
jgi:peptide/nickel transport system ATP-binding protein